MGRKFICFPNTLLKIANIFRSLPRKILLMRFFSLIHIWLILTISRKSRQSIHCLIRNNLRNSLNLIRLINSITTVLCSSNQAAGLKSTWIRWKIHYSTHFSGALWRNWWDLPKNIWRLWINMTIFQRWMTRKPKAKWRRRKALGNRKPTASISLIKNFKQLPIFAADAETLQMSPAPLIKMIEYKYYGIVESIGNFRE